MYHYYLSFAPRRLNINPVSR